MGNISKDQMVKLKEEALKSNKAFVESLKRKTKLELIKIIMEWRFFDGITRPTLEMGLKFNNSKSNSSANGKKGGKKINSSKIELAELILAKHPPTKLQSSSSRVLAEHLNTISKKETFKKDWVIKHLKSYIKK